MPIKKKRCSNSEGPERKKTKRSDNHSRDSSSDGKAICAPSAHRREIQPEDVTVAIFCALVEEAVAMELSFDEELECRTSNERYTYTFGCIGEHYTVIAQPNDVGTVNASNLAAYVSHDFRNIRFALMVGIGGGIPSKENDIRLGDIAVSKAESGHPAVLPYDFVKYEMNNKRVLKGILNKPHPLLQSADLQVQKDEIRDRSELQANLDFIQKKNHRYRHPGSKDILYDSTFCHVEVGKDCSACEKTSSKKIVERSGIRDGPIVHRGLILSGNGVIKDPDERHRLCSGSDNALCFEMEAAGIMDEIPCLVIRGICDYCDSHKQNGWHYYASAVAAAYAKTILLKIHGRDTNKLERITDTLEKVDKKVDDLQEYVRHQNVSSEKEILHRQLVQRLPGPDFLKRKQDILNNYVPSTTEWFFKTDAFLTWCNGTGSDTLYVEGITGAGKSMLAALTTEHLLHQREVDPATASIDVLYVYYDYKDPASHRCLDIVSGMLKQLLSSGRTLSPATVKEIQTTWPLPKDRLFEILLEDMKNSTIFLVIDALDECSVSNRQELEYLISRIQYTTREKIADIRLFTTSRPNKLNETLIGGTKTTFRARDSDLSSLLDHQIGQKTNFVPDEVIWRRAKKQAVSIADGVFLIARLKAEAMKSMVSKTALLKSLETPEANLDKVYETSLMRIGDMDSGLRDMAHKLMAWAVVSFRALDMLEIIHALAAESGSTRFDANNVPEPGAILSLAQGLVIYESNSRNIRPVHETAQQILLNYVNNLEQFKFGGPHQYMASVCLTYLAFDDFENGYCETYLEFEERLRSYRLYDYAAQNWGHHAREASKHTRKLLNEQESLMLKVFENDAKLSACTQALVAGAYSWARQEGSTQMKGLHVASYFGLEHSTMTLLQNERNVDVKDASGWTPLCYAVDNAHDVVVRLLLEHGGADPNPRGDFDWKPLLHAAVKGQKGIVKILLDNDADPEIRNEDGQTPLSLALEYEYMEVARLLLDRGADPNIQDIYGETPLSCAVKNRRAKAVEILLNEGANPDRKAENGWSPLFHAAENGNSVAAKMLLEKGADPSSRDMYDQIPLMWAVTNGHEAVAKLLLEAENNVNFSSQTGQTSLMFAVENGDEGVIMMLLERGAAVEIRDNNGQTPLSYAAENGCEAVVTKILEKGAEVNTKDNDGGTPLLYAAKNGHKGVILMLLEKGADVKIEYNGQSPLSYAAGDGYEAVVETLLERGAEVDSKDNYGQTPLFYAVRYGHKGVIMALLGKDTEVNCQNRVRKTPLIYAAQNGYKEVVMMLLEKGAEANHKDYYGWTSLSYAAEEGHEEVVIMLLDHCAKTRTEICESPTLLHRAAKHRHEKVVKWLLRTGTNPNLAGRDGRTPLIWAAREGYLEIVQLLLDSDADANAKSRYKQTPLMYASRMGHNAVAKMLLNKCIELDSKDCWNQTSLMMAANNGHEVIVEMLLQRGANPNCKDEDGRTALFFATKEGHRTTTEMLIKYGGM